MTSANADQAEYWSAEAGLTWVAQQARLDALMQPVLDGLLDRAALAPGDRVLDIGCGTGSSAIQAARIVGATGHVLGADISPTMLDLARKRARGIDQIAFDAADAADFPFGPAGFDHMISRFGVMFFADPVQAFGNIARALRPGGRLTFAAWGETAANPWFMIPAQAAKLQLGAPPPVDPDAPGPFAFRDPARVTSILTACGLTDIRAEVESLCLTPSGTAADAARLATSVGPATRTMAHFGGTETDRDAISATVLAGFAPFVTGQGPRIPAQINFFQATKPY